MNKILNKLKLELKIKAILKKEPGIFFSYYLDKYGKEEIKELEKKINSIPNKQETLDFFTEKVDKWRKIIKLEDKIKIVDFYKNNYFKV